MEGTVIYKEEVYKYELDDNGKLWITLPSKLGKIGCEQTRSLNGSDNLKEIVIDILIRKGY